MLIYCSSPWTKDFNINFIFLSNFLVQVLLFSWWMDVNFCWLYILQFLIVSVIEDPVEGVSKLQITSSSNQFDIQIKFYLFLTTYFTISSPQFLKVVDCINSSEFLSFDWKTWNRVIFLILLMHLYRLVNYGPNCIFIFFIFFEVFSAVLWFFPVKFFRWPKFFLQDSNSVRLLLKEGLELE